MRAKNNFLTYEDRKLWSSFHNFFKKFDFAVVPKQFFVQWVLILCFNRSYGAGGVLHLFLKYKP
jgi:hypothetical protein